MKTEDKVLMDRGVGRFLAAGFCPRNMTFLCGTVNDAPDAFVQRLF